MPLKKFILEFPDDVGKIMDVIPTFNFPFSNLHFVVDLL
jgi:hypothetical protein